MIDLINNWILDLRRKGLSNTKIYSIIHDEYEFITRSYVTEFLRSKGLIISTGHGGYRYHSGRGSKYCYEGILFDSLGEFIFYLYYKHRVIGLEKNYTEFKSGNNVYVPDFVDAKGIYYEIKSIYTNDFVGWNVDKLDLFPYPLIIIGSKRLKELRLNLNIKDSWFNKYIKS